MTGRPAESLRERIREALRDREVRRIPDEECEVRAAVSLVLADPAADREDEPDPRVLFVRRAELDGDPWSGHVALPGGRAAESDADLLDTARRETREETGLELSRSAFLGRLDDIHPRSAHLPSIAVTPFVAWHSGPASVIVSRELSGYSWIPISTLSAPDRRGTLTLERPERREFPGIRHEGEIIWGLTFRVVEDFLAVLADL